MKKMILWGIVTLLAGCIESTKGKPDASADTETHSDIPSNMTIDTSDGDTDTDTDGDKDTGEGSNSDTDSDTDTDPASDTGEDGDTNTDAEGDSEDCGKLTPADNQSVDLLDGTSIDAVATYACNKGYHIDGESMLVTSATRVCQSDGSWSGDTPKCVTVTCNELVAPIDGGIVGYSDGTNYGSKVTFVCDDGFDMNGEPTRTCGVDGNWTGTIPACGEVRCSQPAPNGFENGSVVLSDENMSFGAQAIYSCNIGYHISGQGNESTTAVQICDGSGNWSGTQPTCEVVDCGQIDPPENGVILGYSDGTKYSSIVQFGCAANFEMSGSEVATCTADGTWSGTTPACGKVTCDTPINPPNGTVSTTGLEYDSDITYRCDTGFYLLGFPEVESISGKCQGSGTWSIDRPVCMPVECDPPQTPQNGSIVNPKRTYIVGNTVEFSCDDDLAMQGNKTITCQADGTWSGSVPACGESPCEPFSALDNGTITYSDPVNHDFDSTATFQCELGYYIQGYDETIREYTVKCTGAGWDGEKPICQLINCGAAPHYNFAELISDATQTTYGEEAEYRCESNASGTGGILTCSADGEWKGTSPECVVNTCPSLETLEHGSIVLISGDGGEFEAGNMVQFVCKDNYSPSGGDEQLTCLDSGQWYGTAPSCLFDWEHRIEISITGDIIDDQLLFVLEDTTGIDSASVRFSTDPFGYEFDLPHHAESFADGVFWIDVSELAQNVSTIYMFYGNSEAESTDAGLSQLFPQQYDISDTTSLFGDHTYDSFELSETGLLNLEAGNQLHIEAVRIIIKGEINGDAKGYQGESDGDGQDGTSKRDKFGGGGGGGYGDTGGNGGHNGDESTAGDGGAKVGNDNMEIRLGASGGNGATPNEPPGRHDEGKGGQGGGAVWLDAQMIIVLGKISVNGEPGKAAPNTPGSGGGGGGSGGGVLITGELIVFGEDSLIEANGGDGATPSTDLPAGGGGSGGRVKIFYGLDTDLNALEISLAGGLGGDPEQDPDSLEGENGKEGSQLTKAADYRIVAEVATTTTSLDATP